VPLLEFYQAASARHRELDKGALLKEKEVTGLRSVVRKELAQCEKLLEQWKKLKAEEEGTPLPPSASSGATPASSHGSGNKEGGALFLSKFNKFADKISSQVTAAVRTAEMGSSCSVVQEKLLTAASRYTEALSRCNVREEAFLTQELPAYLNELQRIEVQRLEVTAQAMAAWGALHEERAAMEFDRYYASAGAGAASGSTSDSSSAGGAAAASRHPGALPRAIALLDPHEDMVSELNELVCTQGAAPAWSGGTPYALPVSMEDIRAGRLKSNANSVFHRSLGDLMDSQRSSTPSVPVPRFMLYVLAAILLANGGAGLAQEGVFRISPAKAELDAVKARLDAVGLQAMSKGDVLTAVGKDNVFLACALLKDWMRSLSEAVIPSATHYAAAIAIVKKEAAAEAAAAAAAAASSPSSSPDGAPPSLRRGTTLTRPGAGAGAGLSPELSSQLGSFLSSLPMVSQRVLQLLAELVREVTAEERQKTNKMTIDNVSIVLAPGLLRNQSEDPLEMLANSKFEIAFVAMMFKHIAAQQQQGRMPVTMHAMINEVN